MELQIPSTLGNKPAPVSREFVSSHRLEYSVANNLWTFLYAPRSNRKQKGNYSFLEQNVCIGHYLLLILDPSALRKTQVFTCKRKKLRSGKNPVKEVVVYAGLGKILGWWRALTFIIPNVMQDSGASLSLFPWTHIPGLSGWVSDCQNPTLG